MNNFHHGFTTDLHNGLTVSVQFHDGAYANRDNDGVLQSVEIACWKTGDQDMWLTRDVWATADGFDDVMGHIPVDSVMGLMDCAVQLPTDYVSLLATQRKTAITKQKIAELQEELDELQS